ncbi:MAG TPA: flagellar export protein FliJ [Azoarcus sp.]|nr:flagellar export protein FliJ [Azoarcus sp.]
MARRPFALQLLLDQSRARLDEVTGQLGRLIAHEQEGSHKLKQLEEYRQEYALRFSEAARNGLGMDALRNYSAFMERIDKAIEAQRALLEQSRRNTETGKQAWVEQRNRKLAFDTLHTRHRTRESSLERRREQRQTEEHLGNRFHAKTDPQDD